MESISELAVLQLQQDQYGISLESLNGPDAAIDFLSFQSGIKVDAQENTAYKKWFAAGLGTQLNIDELMPANIEEYGSSARHLRFLNSLKSYDLGSGLLSCTSDDSKNGNQVESGFSKIPQSADRHKPATFSTTINWPTVELGDNDKELSSFFDSVWKHEFLEFGSKPASADGDSNSGFETGSSTSSEISIETASSAIDEINITGDCFTDDSFNSTTASDSSSNSSGVPSAKPTVIQMLFSKLTEFFKNIFSTGSKPLAESLVGRMSDTDKAGTRTIKGFFPNLSNTAVGRMSGTDEAGMQAAIRATARTIKGLPTNTVENMSDTDETESKSIGSLFPNLTNSTDALDQLRSDLRSVINSSMSDDDFVEDHFSMPVDVSAPETTSDEPGNTGDPIPPGATGYADISDLGAR